jgi:hypothetical protein
MVDSGTNVNVEAVVTLLRLFELLNVPEIVNVTVLFPLLNESVPLAALVLPDFS